MVDEFQYLVLSEMSYKNMIIVVLKDTYVKDCL